MAIETHSTSESALPNGTPAESGHRVPPPGIGWLLGWVALLWFGLLLTPLMSPLIYRSFVPEAEMTTSVPWSSEWIREVGTYVGHLALVRGADGAVSGLVFGMTAFALLRRHVAHARWLPLLGAVGLAAGESNGVVVSWTFVLSGDTLVLTDPDRFFIRQSLIHNAISGAGLGMVLGYVLRRQLPYYGWWVAACALAFVLSDLLVVLASIRGAGFGVRGVLILLVGLPLTSSITGSSMLVLLRIRDRERRTRAESLRTDPVELPSPPTTQ